MRDWFARALATAIIAMSVGTVLAQGTGGDGAPTAPANVRITAGTTPISGTCTNGFLLYNNNGKIDCVAATGGGNVSNVGTPTAGQIAEWTGATTIQGVAVTGSGSVVRATSPTLTTPTLGTPSSVTLTNATGLPISTGVSGLATGAATFLGTASSANLRALLTDEVGSGAAYFVGGALGTPASGTLTNATGLPISTGVSGLGTNVAAFLSTPSSANLAAAITDETGTGANVFATGPTLSAPVSDRYLVSTSNTNAQSGTTYTITSSDCGKNIILTNASAIAVSMNTGLTAACWVTLTQGGAGQVTVGGTATIHSANGLKTRAQYSVINLMYGGATDTYILSGDSST